MSSLHDLELGEEEAALYDPPDHPPPKPTELNDVAKSEDHDVPKPVKTRDSEDGSAFSVGDDEFGNWADEDDDDDEDTP